ncbi:MAG TPA: GvpL/GvpF family gas vesicle protein [Thermoanaerobaculia bacterium]|nr:GvpL/GvpF family gas vesicle protein [Thermoanaerobaculia bacterium]
MADILYVYAIGVAGGLRAPSVEGVDGSSAFVVVEQGSLEALTSRVDEAEFSQEEIDRKSTDLDWLGRVGYRHQEVVAALRETSDAIPLRAFTLFSGREALRGYLEREAEALGEVLERVRGREEWTLQIGFDERKWSRSVESRSPALARLAREAEKAPEGRAYLLRKKMDEERRNAAREAEQQLVAEIEQHLASALGAPMVVESRQKRSGTFPQIDVLLERARSPEIDSVASDLKNRYGAEGIELTLTGPWPPYTFVAEKRP